MLSLIKTLLETLNLYYKLKNKSFYRDLLESSKRKQKDLIDEIENYVLMVIVLPLIGLTSCSQNSSPKSETLNIFQPSTLHLKAGQPVQTKEGIYTPETDETWHSDKRYRELERKLFFDK